MLVEEIRCIDLSRCPRVRLSLPGIPDRAKPLKLNPVCQMFITSREFLFLLLFSKKIGFRLAFGVSPFLLSVVILPE